MPTPPLAARARQIVPPVGFPARGLAPLEAAQIPHLQNHGGPVIGAVQVVPIYWGDAWSSGNNASLATRLDGFFDFIVGSSYMDLLHEYSTPTTEIRHGSRLASVHVTQTEPGDATPTGRLVTDDQIQSALKGWIADGTAPATTANTLYFIYLPPGTVSSSFGSQSCTAFCGYHSHADKVYYAVIPFVNCDGCKFAGDFFDTLTEVSSHEFAEAITDPELNAWFDPVTGPGDEIGDICNRQTAKLGGFVVQTEWSNQQGACVLGPGFLDWKQLDNNPGTVAIAADEFQLYQLHASGEIFQFNGTPLTGWKSLDVNPATKKIAASGGFLYQLHGTGEIFRYTGTPNVWTKLDANPQTADIVAADGDLYQLHVDGKIFKFTGTPMTGWQLLDSNPSTKKIAGSGGHLYQLHTDGHIFKYTGTPMTGWLELDVNPATSDIVADGGDLYQLHEDGGIFQFNGTPLTGWVLLDDNAATRQIAAGLGRLYQRHQTGLVWKYVTPPKTGWKQLDANPATAQIVAGGVKLYQRHTTGEIFVFTGS